MQWFRRWRAAIAGVAVVIAIGAALASMTPALRSHLIDAFLESLAEHLGALLIAAVATILAWGELRGIRLAAEKRAAAEAIAREAEAKARDAEAAFRESEGRRFIPVSQEIATGVSTILMNNVDWARVALEQAKLAPYAGGAFSERSRQFELEKKALAEEFVPKLLKRCHAFVDSGHEVYLMIDAGTTLYPVFGKLGELSAAQFEQKGGDWLEHLHVTTNNLPGLERLIDTGRRGRGRHSPLVIEHCFLLPGIPMPIFAAVGGPETDAAILAFGQPPVNDRPQKFIALVVGNWVRIRHSEPRCPIPLARGEKGFHLKAKNAFLEKAEEVYVVSPLGKVWLATENQMNEAMGLREGAPDPDDESYVSVTISSKKARIVKLVSTRRAAGKLLHDHSERVQEALALEVSSDDFATAPIDVIPSLFFEFDPPGVRLPLDELNLEFPHKRTRVQRVLNHFKVDLESLRRAEAAPRRN